jgi:hypothetical protein
MRQTRTIQHDESHTDTEELFGDVWAVTQCNCTLVTQEIPMTKYYKFLTAQNTGEYSGFDYSDYLPKGNKTGKWLQNCKD